MMITGADDRENFGERVFTLRTSHAYPRCQGILLVVALGCVKDAARKAVEGWPVLEQVREDARRPARVKGSVLV